MPRSFLVKKTFRHKIPNYGQLDTQKDIGDADDSFSGLVASTFGQNDAEPVFSRTLWDRSSVITRISLNTEAKGTLVCNSRAADIALDSSYHRTPATPLKETLNNLNLPPPVIPKKIAELGCPRGTSQSTSDRLHGVQNNSVTETLARFECFDCHRSYPKFSGLDEHGQLHCELCSRKSFSCKYCEKEYVSLGALKMHIRTHTLPCVCRICSKAFSRPWLLQGHIRTHTGEKPFACPHCSRAFADRSNLRAHLQTHSDIKKYKCRSCSKTFSRIALLCKHQDTGCVPEPPRFPLTMPQNIKCLVPGQTG
ncbi:zinc finger protein SNAI3 [Ambystoma mexicanum]|uniref:zinc finger protein SNAI3 n=1 Tax=Ambystoma mexicanum TaxID=8296 RepID=UPI0037E746C8